jgi:hypothetical protein
MPEYTVGRYVLAVTDAEGARDPFMLTSQVKYMREGFKRLKHEPALILIVVADGEEDAAVARIQKALEEETANA